MDFDYEVIYDDTPYVNITYPNDKDIIDIAMLLSELQYGPQVFQVLFNDDNTTTISYEYFELTQEFSYFDEEEIKIMTDSFKMDLLLHGLHVKNNTLHLGYLYYDGQVEIVVTSPEHLTMGVNAVAA